MDLQKCIEEGYIKKVSIDKPTIEKEIKESENDFKAAETSVNEKNYKWSIVQCYYSMFHSSKALMISFGYKERKHFAVVVFLEHLVKNRYIESRFLNDFKAAMFAREESDYQGIYSKERADKIMEISKEFNKTIKKSIKL
jgi:uncharacterized protein (UPF0332 family)